MSGVWLSVVSKTTIYIIVVILLLYYAFTSGLVFELTKGKADGTLDLPYSMSLSGWRTGITNIASESDVECILWLKEHGNPELPIATDYNTYCTITGFLPVYFNLNGGDRTGFLEDAPDFIDKLPVTYFADKAKEDKIKDRIKEHYAQWVSGECYIFVSSWNTEHKQYVEAVGVGTRITYPLPEFDYPVLHKCGNTVIYHKELPPPEPVKPCG